MDGEQIGKEGNSMISRFGKEDRTKQGPDTDWSILYRTGLLSNLNLVEARRCRSVCSNWRRLSSVARDPCDELRDGLPGGLSQPVMEALWAEDLGDHRGQAWKDWAKLCDRTSPFDSAIRRDVHRTLPQEELFRERQGKGQLALFRLLRALAIRLEDVGYCQSLNFVVATLIGVVASMCALLHGPLEFARFTGS
eukprot:s216_g5.t1